MYSNRTVRILRVHMYYNPAANNSDDFHRNHSTGLNSGGANFVDFTKGVCFSPKSNALELDASRSTIEFH